jgi:copper chaperone
MTIEVTVEGMTCDGCEQTIVAALEKVEEVEHASADRTAQKVTVEGTADKESVIETIEGAGYTPRPQGRYPVR